tara:strand:+ start:502 stop:831 length:330 start_codon:yes stop_codon:yes gene_type:complete
MPQQLQMLNGTLERRIDNMETGLQQLDEKISTIDKKVDHLGNVQMEMFDNQNELGETMKRGQQDLQDQLHKWQGDIRKEMLQKGAWHYYTMGCLLISWFIFMLYWLLHA